MEQQREINCRCVEAEVKQTLGYIECCGTLLALTCAVVDESVKHELMLADGRYGQFVAVLE